MLGEPLPRRAPVENSRPEASLAEADFGVAPHPGSVVETLKRSPDGISWVSFNAISESDFVAIMMNVLPVFEQHDAEVSQPDNDKLIAQHGLVSSFYDRLCCEAPINLLDLLDGLVSETALTFGSFEGYEVGRKALIPVREISVAFRAFDDIELAGAKLSFKILQGQPIGLTLKWDEPFLESSAFTARRMQLTRRIQLCIEREVENCSSANVEIGLLPGVQDFSKALNTRAFADFPALLVPMIGSEGPRSHIERANKLSSLIFAGGVLTRLSEVSCNAQSMAERYQRAKFMPGEWKLLAVLDDQRRSLIIPVQAGLSTAQLSSEYLWLKSLQDASLSVPAAQRSSPVCISAVLNRGNGVSEFINACELKVSERLYDRIWNDSRIEIDDLLESAGSGQMFRVGEAASVTFGANSDWSRSNVCEPIRHGAILPSIEVRHASGCRDADGLAQDAELPFGAESREVLLKWNSGILQIGGDQIGQRALFNRLFDKLTRDDRKQGTEMTIKQHPISPLLALMARR